MRRYLLTIFLFSYFLAVLAAPALYREDALLKRQIGSIIPIIASTTPLASIPDVAALNPSTAPVASILGGAGDSTASATDDSATATDASAAAAPTDAPADPSDSSPIEPPPSAGAPASGDGAPFSGPSTVTTHQVIPVPGGTVTEDCTITLTPIVVDGENLVREDRDCEDVFTPSDDSSSGDGSGDSGSSTDGGDGGSSTDGGDSGSSTDSGSGTDSGGSTDTGTSTDSGASTDTGTSTSTDTDSSSATDTGSFSDTDTGTASSTDTGSGTDSASETSTATTTDSSSATSTDSSDGAFPTDGGDGSTDGPIAILPSTTVSGTDLGDNSDGNPTASRASDQAPATSSAGLPGQKLEVLPIGLGVFAGISVIALIVVGLVTYERTKYRKAFRQRRLAASGAEMGYGGTAERR